MAGEESAKLPGSFPGEALQAPVPEILGVSAVPPAPNAAVSSRQKPWKIPPPSPPCDEGTRTTMQPTEGRVSFEELAVYFTQEEWTSAGHVKCSKEFSKQGRGPQITKPDLISWLEEEEELFLVGCDEEQGLADGSLGVVQESANETKQLPLTKKEDTSSDVNEKFEDFHVLWKQLSLLDNKKALEIHISPTTAILGCDLSAPAGKLSV
uniref:Uncharacterized protein n=1 Tax=Sphaerodactylus townsendi TaxID=933632 RepID=A0ACB8EEZ7_9SAUR